MADGFDVYRSRKNMLANNSRLRIIPQQRIDRRFGRIRIIGKTIREDRRGHARVIREIKKISITKQIIRVAAPPRPFTGHAGRQIFAEAEILRRQVATNFGDQRHEMP